MNPWVEMVREFHEKFGLPVGDKPAFPSPERCNLRVELTAEEDEEFFDAVGSESLPGVADSLVDLLYVTIGAALEFGIDLDPLFTEVHAANMRKVGGGLRADGKVLKPEGWQPPRIADLLEEQARR